MKVQIFKDDFYLYEASPFDTTAPWGITIDWPDDLDYDKYEKACLNFRHWQKNLADVYSKHKEIKVCES